MHYYSRHIGDYLKNTSHLSLLEHGIYSRLMDVYYVTEQAIQDKDKYRCVAARTPEEKESVDAVLGDFFKLTDGLWKHERCDKEIEKYQRNADKNRANGANGGRPRLDANVSKLKPKGSPNAF